MVLLVLLMVWATAAGQSSFGGGPWRLSAVMLPDAAPAEPTIPLWFGVRNEASNAKLVCVGGWDATLRAAAGNEGFGRGVSPHACLNVGSYEIVLPGETHYTVVAMDPRRVSLRDVSGLELRVTIFEWTTGESSRRRESALTWSGSPETARAAGDKLGLVAR